MSFPTCFSKWEKKNILDVRDDGNFLGKME